MMECICDCGTVKAVHYQPLRNGVTKSCGCIRVDRAIHGMWKSTEYRVWGGMKQRCHNARCVHYSRYGGRGIKVCKRWRDSFQAFLKDVGPRPSMDHSLDRFPDNDGDYKPGNVRWATREEQRANTRAVVWERIVFLLAGSEFSKVSEMVKQGVADSEIAQHIARIFKPKVSN